MIEAFHWFDELRSESDRLRRGRDVWRVRGTRSPASRPLFCRKNRCNSPHHADAPNLLGKAKRMRSMLQTLIFAAAIPLGVAGQGDVRPAAFGSSDRAMPVSTSAGERVLIVREVRTDVILPGGKRHIGSLVVFFDAQTGYCLSRFASQPEKSGPLALRDVIIADSIAYVAADRLALFTVFASGLYISESSGRASSLDDAQKKGVAEAKGALDDIEKGRQRGRSLSLWAIGQDFVTPPGDSFARPIKILSVAQKDGLWEVTLKGQWTARVTIEGSDGSYTIKSFVRIGASK